MKHKCLFSFLLLFIGLLPGYAQIKWSNDGNSYYQLEGGEIVNVTLPQNQKRIVIGKSSLLPAGKSAPIEISEFQFSDDYARALLFTNTKKVWRYNTKGDYWIKDLNTGSLSQVGATMPPSSLMFAKFSPDGAKVAYVSNYNLYVEDIKSHNVNQLTTGGNRRNIYGTFDWAYEEELDDRDGFRWSPDGSKIALWHIDASKVRDIPLINNTDSIAPFVVPVEYPLVGESPSPARIGVVSLENGKIVWMKIPGDAQQNYLPRMEWTANSGELMVQQLNRKQNETTLYLCNVNTTEALAIYHEKDDAFIECRGQFAGPGNMGWVWVNGGKEFIWASEKDGWTHAFRISRDGKKEKLLTTGNYDISEINLVDEKNNVLLFTASPANTLRRALYKANLTTGGEPVRISPEDQQGTHDYNISPNGAFARHSFNNNYTPGATEFIQVKNHTVIQGTGSVVDALKKSANNRKTEFFNVTTKDGIVLDGWMVKPANFDAKKKYPVVFFVYGEPAGTTVLDRYGVSYNYLYKGSMAEDGYIAMALDNRGTPSLKGRAWRKSIYKNIGILNIRDQAQGVQEVLKWTFVDAERLFVWGWSGGANTTLHLLGQYPNLFKAGFAGASVASQLTYDNIYTERYMGLPKEDMDAYIKGSPITYVKNIKANLLYVHGTGDDNVHYQNAELLLNEFIKYNKQVRFMAYPNRTHGASEGEGTYEHLTTLYTNFLKEFCPPGGR